MWYESRALPCMKIVPGGQDGISPVPGDVAAALCVAARDLMKHLENVPVTFNHGGTAFGGGLGIHRCVDGRPAHVAPGAHIGTFLYEQVKELSHAFLKVLSFLAIALLHLPDIARADRAPRREAREERSRCVSFAVRLVSFAPCDAGIRPVVSAPAWISSMARHGR